MLSRGDLLREGVGSVGRGAFSPRDKTAEERTTGRAGSLACNEG